MVAAGESGYSEQEVTVQTLNDFIAQEHIDKIGVVKIDVEGWEQQVLLGAGDLLRKKDAPIWVVEYNSTQKTQGATPAEVYHHILSTNDYRAFKSAKGKQIISPLVPISGVYDLPENDNIFYILEASISGLPASMFH